MPTGLTAFMLTDGYIYFLDANGEKKFTHFHDTQFSSNLAIVADNVIAYRNRTEIVFLDFQGKEIGTFEMPEARINQNFEELFGSGHGTVRTFGKDGALHFIKMN